MWVHNLDPNIVTFGALQVRWYGLAYVVGFLLGMFWLLYYRRQLSLSKDDVYDLAFYVMIGVVIGSRLFHVVFWEPSYYFSQPWKIFYLWEGGMAYHGGLVGAIVATAAYCKKKTVKFWKVADVMSVPAVLALGLGRLANFVNAELVGIVTNVSWCVDFGDGECRHPYQLYSALKRFVIAGMLFSVMRMRVYKDGFIFWLMVLLMGTGRFFLDYLREDSTLYFALSVGQWMSLVMAVVGVAVLWKNYRQDLGKLFK
jgi:phosphatidylglycerol---prolipoprotein diacylglyceryl transferase